MSVTVRVECILCKTFFFNNSISGVSKDNAAIVDLNTFKMINPPFASFSYFFLVIVYVVMHVRVLLHSPSYASQNLLLPNVHVISAVST